MSRIKFLNIEVDNLTMQEVLERIEQLIQCKKNSYVVTPNVDHVVKIEHDPEFAELYRKADLILTDGMPLVWISRLQKNRIKEKISGSDLFPKLCELSAKNDYSMFLLGAAEGVAEIAAQKLRLRYKGLNIVGTYSPYYGFENDSIEINKIIKIINRAKPDILIVSFGAPKQEKFIYKYKEKLNVPISLGLGASIDFEAGKIKRAPRFMQRLGMEWIYRLFQEPRRMFKRYLVDDLEIIKIIFKYGRRKK